MNTSLVVPYKGSVVGIANEGDAGLDLAVVGDHTLLPWEKKLIGTGAFFALPRNTVGLLAPRSSSGKINLVLANTLGIIDCTYRDEVKIFVRNMHPTDVLALKDGQSVAQLIIVPFITPILTKVAELPESNRGLNGFGSSDTRGYALTYSGIRSINMDTMACLSCGLDDADCGCARIEN